MCSIGTPQRFRDSFIENNLITAKFDAPKSLIRNRELIIQKIDKGNRKFLFNRTSYYLK